MQDWIVGGIAGIALVVANYWLWKLLFVVMVRRHGRGERGTLILSFLKIGVNFVAVVLAIGILDLHPIAFLVGLTLGVLGLVVKGLLA